MQISSCDQLMGQATVSCRVLMRCSTSVLPRTNKARRHQGLRSGVHKLDKSTGFMQGDTEGPAEHGDEVRREELAAVKSVAHFFPLGTWWQPKCVTHWHGSLLFVWIVRGDNKQAGWGASTSPLLACQSFLIRRTAKVACLQSLAYFPALRQNGNGLNLFLCECMSGFN